jgi:hypothetical protein
MSDTKIPLYILEEHNEAFYAWNYAIKEGLMPDSQNFLLHIDEHSDMNTGRFKRSIHELDGNLSEIKKFTCGELAIDTFISAAIYRNIFTGVQWVRQRHDGNIQTRSRQMYVRSYNNQGKKLIIGVKSDGELYERLEQDITIRYFDYCWTNAGNITRKFQTILDIDLDFFSCTGQPSKQKTLLIEISADEYESFSADPYHRLKFAFSRVETYSSNGKYYYAINDYDEVIRENTYVDEKMIFARIAELTAVLKKEEITPLIITLCRSRFSGYTPEDQWQYIETQLCSQLGEIYQLELIEFSQL